MVPFKGINSLEIPLSMVRLLINPMLLSNKPGNMTPHAVANRLLRPHLNDHQVTSDAQWPWEKMGIRFWLLDFKGEPSPKKREKRYHWATRKLSKIGSGGKVSREMHHLINRLTDMDGCEIRFSHHRSEPLVSNSIPQSKYRKKRCGVSFSCFHFVVRDSRISQPSTVVVITMFFPQQLKALGSQPR